MKLVSNMLSFAVLGALGEERLPATRTLDLGSGRARPRYKHEAPPPPPPSRTNWTRLVPPLVLSGHDSSLPSY